MSMEKSFISTRFTLSNLIKGLRFKTELPKKLKVMSVTPHKFELYSVKTQQKSRMHTDAKPLHFIIMKVLMKVSDSSAAPDHCS